MTMEKKLHPSFQHRQYSLRRKVFKLFGDVFYIYDETGNLAFYSKRKASKLREDFRTYSDKSEAEEVLIIKTSQIIDFGATYNVQDPITGESVGALRRKGIKSIIRNEWVFLCNEGKEIGKLIESSIVRAILRNFLPFIMPRCTIFSTEGEKVASIKQQLSLFVLKYKMTINEENSLIDRRLLIASMILLAGIEGGKQ